MDHSTNEYFPLAAGPVTIGLRFDDPGSTIALGGYFSGYRGGAEPDLFLDFTVEGHSDFPEIPESLVQAKKRTDGGFAIAGDLFRGSFDAEGNRWEIIIKNILTKGQITRVFEQFLYQAFYSACRRRGTDAILLHSCGVRAEGGGFLFAGPSGMGKSTVAELSREYGVINDEMNIIAFGGKEPVLHPSPFNAYFTGKSAEVSPVRAVFLLRHDARCRLEPVSPAEAAAGVTGQIVPKIGIEDGYSSDSAKTMLNEAIRLAAAVPAFKLYFPVTGGFWPLIRERFA